MTTLFNVTESRNSYNNKSNKYIKIGDEKL